MASREETETRAGNFSGVEWRLGDIVVGVISGAVCSVLAAFIEGFIATVRIFSFGRIGAYGEDLLIVAVAGALLGGIVGACFGTVVKPRELSR
jgi:hypothetical protein